MIGNTLADDDPHPLVAVIAIENILSWPAKLYPQEASSKEWLITDLIKLSFGLGWIKEESGFPSLVNFKYEVPGLLIVVSPVAKSMVKNSTGNP